MELNDDAEYREFIYTHPLMEGFHALHEMSEDEMERFREQLSTILENFEILQQVDTSDVSSTAHSVALQNVLRDDEVKPSLPADEVLRNAPNQEGGYFKVRAVLE